MLEQCDGSQQSALTDDTEPSAPSRRRRTEPDLSSLTQGREHAPRTATDFVAEDAESLDCRSGVARVADLEAPRSGEERVAGLEAHLAEPATTEETKRLSNHAVELLTGGKHRSSDLDAADRELQKVHPLAAGLCVQCQASPRVATLPCGCIRLCASCDAQVADLPDQIKIRWYCAHAATCLHRVGGQ